MIAEDTVALARYVYNAASQPRIMGLFPRRSKKGVEVVLICENIHYHFPSRKRMRFVEALCTYSFVPLYVSSSQEPDKFSLFLEGVKGAFRVPASHTNFSELFFFSCSHS